MKTIDFADELPQKIPLSTAMGIVVKENTSQRSVLNVALRPNLNHVLTAFGGSLYSAGALACYGLFRAISAESGIDSDQLVIREGSIRYLAPVTTDFEAICERPEENEVQRFLEQLRRHGKSRLSLKARILQDGSVRAEFSGDYVFSRP